MVSSILTVRSENQIGNLRISLLIRLKIHKVIMLALLCSDGQKKNGLRLYEADTSVMTSMWTKLDLCRGREPVNLWVLQDLDGILIRALLVIF